MLPFAVIAIFLTATAARLRGRHQGRRAAQRARRPGPAGDYEAPVIKREEDLKDPFVDRVIEPRRRSSSPGCPKRFLPTDVPRQAAPQAGASPGGANPRRSTASSSSASCRSWPSPCCGWWCGRITSLHGQDAGGRVRVHRLRRGHRPRRLAQPRRGRASADHPPEAARRPRPAHHQRRGRARVRAGPGPHRHHGAGTAVRGVLPHAG